jgi:hypothetical protein
MPKLETIRKNQSERLSSRRLDCAELITLYNRLDNQQKIEFQQRLTQIIKKPILPQQVEDYLFSLNAESYDRILVYTKLLLCC